MNEKLKVASMAGEIFLNKEGIYKIELSLVMDFFKNKKGDKQSFIEVCYYKGDENILIKNLRKEFSLNNQENVEFFLSEMEFLKSYLYVLNDFFEKEEYKNPGKLKLKREIRHDGDKIDEILFWKKATLNNGEEMNIEYSYDKERKKVTLRSVSYNKIYFGILESIVMDEEILLSSNQKLRIL